MHRDARRGREKNHCSSRRTGAAATQPGIVKRSGSQEIGLATLEIEQAQRLLEADEEPATRPINAAAANPSAASAGR